MTIKSDRWIKRMALDQRMIGKEAGQFAPDRQVHAVVVVGVTIGLVMFWIKVIRDSR